MVDLDKFIEQIFESYKAAVLARDVERFVGLYDPEVRVFDAWGVWSYEGLPAWRGAVEGWFTSLGTERVQVTFTDVKTVPSRDLIMVSAIVTYAGISEQGEPLRAMQNRLTWALRLRGHVVQVVHEHTSAPIGINDSKAILQREGVA